MNKGLEAFERFCDDVMQCVNSGGIHYVDKKNKDIIEKELKEHEQYKAIEGELGIDLITLFKALTDGIWIQEVHDKKKSIHVKVTLYYLEGFIIPYKKRYDKEGNYFGSVRYFSDYKRTWALKEEDLGTWALTRKELL